jgi:hypothetical protein
VEHRADAQHHRQETEERQRRELEPDAAGKELARQQPDNAGRCDEHEPVQHLRELVRIARVHLLAEHGGCARERVEDRRRVVLAPRLGPGKLAVMDQQVRVLTMLARVVTAAA